MFGFVIGFASLVGLISVLRKGRCAGRFHGGDCGHHHHHHHGHGGPPWARHGRGPHRWMHRLFERLDTTPGQEKEIRAAVRDFMDEAWDLGGQLRDLPRSASETCRNEEGGGVGPEGDGGGGSGEGVLVQEGGEGCAGMGWARSGPTAAKGRGAGAGDHVGKLVDVS